MEKVEKDYKYLPDFVMICPGKIEAKFLWRQGDELVWEGRMWNHPDSPFGATVPYILVTDMEGNKIRTEDMEFFLDRWYMPGSESLKKRIAEQRIVWDEWDKERAAKGIVEEDVEEDVE
jgi:hypothetical protein